MSARRRMEVVERGNLEMYAAGLEARVDILEAQNAELKRRIRLARRLLSPLGKRYGEPADVPLFDVDRALDLSKPLPRSRR